MKRRSFLYSSLFTSLGSIPSSLIARPTWSTAADLPLNVQEIYPAVHQGKLYVAGGIASKLGVIYFTNRFLSFDPNSNSWADETALPEQLHHAALVSTGERLFLVGGFNGSYSHVWRMRQKVYEYSEKRWIERAALPKPQAEGILAADKQDIHLVTGQSPRGKANVARSDHQEVTTHLIWQAGNTAWESAAPIPIACNSATGGWVGQELIISGGRTAKGNYNHTQIYDKNEDRWRQAAPLPLPQAGTASVSTEQGIIVFGGEIFTPNAGVFKNVWHYNRIKDSWSALPDLRTPRHGLGAGKINGLIYVVGGATEPSGKGTSRVNEVLSL